MAKQRSTTLRFFIQSSIEFSAFILTGFFIQLKRNNDFYPSNFQLITQCLARVSLISQHRFRPRFQMPAFSDNPNPVKQSFRVSALMGLSTTQAKTQWCAICRQMDFGTKAASRATQPMTAEFIGVLF